MTATSIHLYKGRAITPAEIVAYVRARDGWVSIADVRRNVLDGQSSERPMLHVIIKELIKAGELEQRAGTSYFEFRGRT